MKVSTRRWLLAPLRQLRTRRLMAQHGPTLAYDSAWVLITLVQSPNETDLVRTWANENPDGPPGVHHDRWDGLSAAEQTRRRQWLHRHGHSPIQLLHLATDLIESAGIRVVDWCPPRPPQESNLAPPTKS